MTTPFVRTFVVALVAMSLTLVSTTAAAKSRETQRFALLIGANDGGPERVRLQYAVSDARQLSSVLSEMGGVRKADQLLVLEPTPEKLDAEFSVMRRRIDEARRRDRRTELILYYSGHSDEEGILLGTERVGYKDLRKMIKSLPADVRVVILDSCSSGALTRSKGGKRVPSFLRDEAVEVTGQAILTSSSADEAAQESDRLKGSFFTHALVAGLRGAADVTGDRRVTLNEAYRFAFEETLSQTEKTRGGAQHPAYDIQLTGHGDLVLTALDNDAAVLKFDKALGGRLFVRDEADALVAELYKRSGRAMELGLPGATYTVRLDTRDAAYIAMVKVRDGQQATLSMNQFVPVGKELTVLRGTNSGVRPGVQKDVQPLPPTSDGTLFIGADFLPYIGTSSALPNHRRFISFNVLGGLSAGVSGFELGGVANIDRGSVHGVQIGGVANVVTGNANALQLGGVTNVVRGDARGLQIAAGANVNANDFSGLQMSAININAGNTYGLQLGAINVNSGKSRGATIGGVNIGVGDTYGFQVGGVNVVSDNMFGTQIGGVNAQTGQFGGLQIGAINNAGPVNGTQIGAINFSRGDVTGVQVGAINVASTSEASIGAINIFWNGDTMIDASTNELGQMNVGIRHGSGSIYNTYFVGTTPFLQYTDPSTDDSERIGGVSFGLGLGWQRQFRPMLSLEVDALTQAFINEYSTFATGPTQLHTLRGSISWRPLSWLAIYAGPSANVFLSPTASASDYLQIANPWVVRPRSEGKPYEVSLFSGLTMGVRLF